MWELDYEESWVPKDWCFWTVVLEKTLESPLYCKEINLVHPKGSSEYSLEGQMLKLKLQHFGHLTQKADSLEKTLMLGKIEGRRRRGQQKMRWWMASPTRWTWVWTSSRSWWRIGKSGVLQSMGCKESDTSERLNWTANTLQHYRNNINGLWDTLKVKVKVKLLGHVWLFATQWTVAHQTPHITKYQ